MVDYSWTGVGGVFWFCRRPTTQGEVTLGPRPIAVAGLECLKIQKSGDWHLTQIATEDRGERKRLRLKEKT